MTLPMREVREVVRDEMAMHGEILAALAAGPLTVPEIAAAIGQPEREVLVWVMGMRRYGHVKEQPGIADGFFRYAAVKKARP